MKMQRRKPQELTLGPAIRPSEELLDWLEREGESDTGERRTFRLPVVVCFADSGHLGIGEVFIGKSDTDRHDDTIFLDVDDGAMGISFLTRIVDRCPPGQESVCVWLDGYWGTLLGAEDGLGAILGALGVSGADASKRPFAALSVSDRKATDEVRGFLSS
jgi:hypothetical protein